MKTKYLIVALWITCLLAGFLLVTKAQEPTYSSCASGSELFVPPNIDVMALLNMPIAVEPWHGSETVFANDLSGWDIPLPSEMSMLWHLFARNRDGRDYVIYATTHASKPAEAWIWTIPLDQTTDSQGNQLGNHPICDLYTTPIENAMEVLK